jgi:predicted Zn-dependent peptidase
MKARILALPALVALALAGRTARAADPKLEHLRYPLANGLEVILHQDRTVPLVVVNVWYHVGSADDTPGKSGFAHLFEHMMFQGTEHTGDDAHFKVLRAIGASNVNGTTNHDRTNYFEQVPSHQLEAALWLESERMGYMLPRLTEKSLANQRDVVRNERRQGIDNQPYGLEFMKLHEMLYPEGSPYRYATIGRHEDLAAASVDDVRGFFQKWYVPANATLCIAGDFEIDAAKALVQKWFGTFPGGQKPARMSVAAAPLAATRRETVPDKFARLRRVRYAWHSPLLFAPGDAELDVLAHVLGEEGTGRLYRILVHEKQLAQSVDVYQWSGQFASSFHIEVDLKGDADLATVERILGEEIDRVAREPITSAELSRAVTGFESTFIWGLERLMAKADRLQQYNQATGNPDGVAADLGRYRAVSRNAVRDTAARVLRQPRVEVITMPEGGNTP